MLAVYVLPGPGQNDKNEKLEILRPTKYKALTKSFVDIFNKSNKFLLYNFYTQ